MLQFLPRGIFPEQEPRPPLLPDPTPRLLRKPEGPGYVPQAMQTEGAFLRPMSERRRAAMEDILATSPTMNRGTIRPDERGPIRRAIDESAFGRAVARRTGQTPLNLADPRGLQLPERFESGLTNLARSGVGAFERAAPEGSIAQQQAERFVQATDPRTDPSPLPHSEHPLALAAEGLGSFVPVMIPGGAARALGATGLQALVTTAATLFPVFYGEAAEELEQAGASPEQVNVAAPAIALANTTLNAIVPTRMGGRLTTGAATRRTAGQVAQRWLAEGIEEGLTESGEGATRMVAEALMLDNPLLSYENAEEVAQSYKAGFFTALAAGGGTEVAQSAGPAFGRTVVHALTDQQGKLVPQRGQSLEEWKADQEVYENLDQDGLRAAFDKFDESQSNVSFEEVMEALPDIVADRPWDTEVSKNIAEDRANKGEPQMPVEQIVVAEAISKLSREKGIELREQARLEEQTPEPVSVESLEAMPEFAEADPVTQVVVKAAADPSTSSRATWASLPNWLLETMRDAAKRSGRADIMAMREEHPIRFRGLLEAMVQADAARARYQAAREGADTLDKAAQTLPDAANAFRAANDRIADIVTGRHPGVEPNPPQPLTQREARAQAEALPADKLGNRELLAERLAETGLSGQGAARTMQATDELPSSPAMALAADQAVAEHNAKPLDARGTTLTADGQPAETARFVLSPYEDRETVAPGVELDPRLWLGFRDANRDLLSQPNHYVGTFSPDPESEAGYTGKTFYDVSIGVGDPREAAALLREHNQDSAFDSTTGKVMTPEQLDALADEMENQTQPAPAGEIRPPQTVQQLAQDGKLVEALIRARQAINGIVQGLGIDAHTRGRDMNLERSDLKESNQKRLAARMAEMFDAGKLEQALRESGYHIGAMSNYSNDPADVMTVEEKISEAVNDFMGGWAASAANSHDMSLALQAAANEMLGGTARTDYFQHGANYYSKNMPLARMFLQAMYAETQERLAEAGYGPDDPLVLARGVQFRSSSSNYGAGDFQYMQPLNSFSTEMDVARDFAGGGSGLLLIGNIPRRNIIGTPASGCGCLVEGEVLVAGGQYDDDVLITKQVTSLSALGTSHMASALDDWINEHPTLRDRVWDNMAETWAPWSSNRTTQQIERLMDAVHGDVSWALDPDIKVDLIEAGQMMPGGFAGKQAMREMLRVVFDRAHNIWQVGDSDRALGSVLREQLRQEGVPEKYLDRFATLRSGSDDSAFAEIWADAHNEEFALAAKKDNLPPMLKLGYKYAPARWAKPELVIQYARDNINPDASTRDVLDLGYSAIGNIDSGSAVMRTLLGSRGQNPVLIEENEDPYGEIVQDVIAKGRP